MLSKEVRQLQNTWDRGDFPKHLEWIEIDGIRGWTGQRIDFKFPIVCISGENGIGKSTILQAAASAYKNERQDLNPYYASDFFPDTPWEQVTNVFIRVSLRQGSQTLTHVVRKPTNRWRGNPERSERTVIFLDLRRTQPLYAKLGYSQLIRGNPVEGAANIFPNETLQRFSAIVGKSYTSAKSATLKDSPNRPVPVVEVGALRYSGFHQGAGESTIAELLALNIPNYSLVLIDEIETSLHPRAQRRLMRDLANISREKKAQFIVTTHSPYIMEELLPEARVHILGSTDNKRVVFGVSPEFALTKMDDIAVPELEVYAEDARAKILIEEIIASRGLEYLSRMTITPFGKASVGKALGLMKSENRFRQKTIVVLDGDQDPSIGCLLLPGNDAPEVTVFLELQADRWQSIADKLARSHSDMVDLCNRVMTEQDHHNWVKDVADHLLVGGDELWRAMARRWCTITSHSQNCDELFEQIRSEIDG